MRIGELIHRVRIDAQESGASDPQTGRASLMWTTWLQDEPARMSWPRGREFEAAGATRAELAAVCRVRYRPGYQPTMRVVFEGSEYNIRAVRPDRTARGYLELDLTSGVNDGR